MALGEIIGLETGQIKKSKPKDIGFLPAQEPPVEKDLPPISRCNKIVRSRSWNRSRWPILGPERIPGGENPGDEMPDKNRTVEDSALEGRPAAPVVVLAMHGAPPLDFPGDELTEFFSLQARMSHGRAGPRELRPRYEELEAKVRSWPRTGENDPFYAGSVELAGQLHRESGLEVFLGFNEFCSPSLAEALDRAAGSAPKILVISPMMTRGGEHAAVDIPEAILAARGRNPHCEFIYVWPFPTEDIARFLASRLSPYI
jgi:sirohydrochlorin cobaltochelatase